MGQCAGGCCGSGPDEHPPRPPPYMGQGRVLTKVQATTLPHQQPYYSTHPRTLDKGSYNQTSKNDVNSQSNGHKAVNNTMTSSGGVSIYHKFTLPVLKPSSPAVSEQKITALFETYRDSDADDTIQYDGIERLCRDLELNPEEFRVLLLAWRMNAERMCVFTREEFVQGCRSLRADSIKTLKERLVDLQTDAVKDHEKYKELYRFTFRFGLEPGMRVLPLAIAIALWKLVFSLNEPLILERWLKFLDKHEIKGIPRDTWNMFLNFVDAVGDDLSLYDDTEAWPSLLDDFVEYETDARNQNTPDFNSAPPNA